METHYEKIIRKKTRIKKQSKPHSFSKSSGSRARQALRKSGVLPVKTKVKIKFA